MPPKHASVVAWQRADDLFVRLHVLTRQAFPAFERFELGAQMRRSAYSVGANIAEGLARRQRQDRLRFLNIAESSLVEVGYGIHVAGRLGYFSNDLVLELETDLRRTFAALIGLIRYVRAQNEPA